MRSLAVSIGLALAAGCGGAPTTATSPDAPRAAASGDPETAGANADARRAPAPAPAPAPGRRLPPLAFPLIDGGQWTPAAARGSVLVIDVWASWCKPCRKGFPKLNAMMRKYPEVSFVAISIDEDSDSLQKFLADVPIELPVARDAELTLTGEPLEVERIPAVIVVDADGFVRHRVEEPDDDDYTEIDRIVRALAAATAPPTDSPDTR